MPSPAYEPKPKRRHFPRWEPHSPVCSVHGCKMLLVTCRMPKFCATGESDFMVNYRQERKIYRCPRKNCHRVDIAEHATLLSEEFHRNHQNTLI